MEIKIVSTQDFASRIDANKDYIVNAFVEISRARIAAARNEPERNLIDHLPELLGKIAIYLLSRGNSLERDTISALAFMHGKVRSRIGSSYTAAEIRCEHGIVRNQMLSLLRDHEEICKEAVALFTEACEVIASATIESFTVTRTREVEFNEH